MPFSSCSRLGVFLEHICFSFILGPLKKTKCVVSAVTELPQMCACVPDGRGNVVALQNLTFVHKLLLCAWQLQHLFKLMKG